jgi:hypothetical protein
VNPTLSASKTISVTVREVNLAPLLGAIASRIVYVGESVSFKAHATDADLPANTLSYLLEGVVPGNAALNAGTGDFAYTAAEAEAGHVFHLTVRAKDNGSPALSDAKSFDLSVVARPVATIDWDGTTARIHWTGVVGRKYRVERRATPDAGDWTALAGDADGTGATQTKQDPDGVTASERYYRIVVLP